MAYRFSKGYNKVTKTPYILHFKICGGIIDIMRQEVTYMKKLVLLLIPFILCSCTKIDDEQSSITKTDTDISEIITSEEISTVSTSQEETAPAVTTEAVLSPVKENIDYKSFEAQIDKCIEDNDTVGMGLCVFADGKVIYEINRGTADKEQGIPCDHNTVYRVASVSKLVSAMALMTLYDEGKLDPYTDLEELTGLPYNSSADNERVLLWHLLTHTAGLVDGTAYNESPSKYYSTSYVLEKSNLGYKPGTQYLYTNFGAGTVGSVAELVTGEYFHDFADRVLFSKLDMDAAYCANMLDNRQNCANIYSGGALRISPKTWGRSTSYYESFGLGNSYLNAQCELLISPKNLARLGIVISGDGTVDGVRILSREAVDLINTPYYHSGELSFDVGLSTRIYEGNLVEGHRIFGHSGSAYGNVCGLYYDPANHTGVAICTNGCYIGSNPNNDVFRILDECINCVYDYFFN